MRSGMDKEPPVLKSQATKRIKRPARTEGRSAVLTQYSTLGHSHLDFESLAESSDHSSFVPGVQISFA